MKGGMIGSIGASGGLLQRRLDLPEAIDHAVDAEIG